MEYFQAMTGNFNDLGKKTSDVISNLEGTDVYFLHLEKRFTGIKRIISKHSKR